MMVFLLLKKGHCLKCLDIKKSIRSVGTVGENFLHERL